MGASANYLWGEIPAVEVSYFVPPGNKLSDGWKYIIIFQVILPYNWKRANPHA
jgi:hypothetical protein